MEKFTPETPEEENKKSPEESRAELLEAVSESFFHHVQANIEDEDAYIDQGGAAIIYSFNNEIAPEFKNKLCVKVIKNRSEHPDAEYDLGNSISKEAYFHEKFHGQVAGGVKAPGYVGVFETDELKGMVMEQLNAVNMQHVVNGTEEMPEGFDLSRGFDGVQEYLEMMHNQGVVHGDLEARNIMVDRETGAPYVIDFGRSKEKGSCKDEKEWEELVDKDYDTYDRVFVAAEDILTKEEK